MNNMNTNQELKMQLLDKYADAGDKQSIDFIREAYKFLTEGETEIPRIPLSGGKKKDGIYVILKNGGYELWDKEAEYNHDSIAYIGLIHEGHPFAVALEDLGSYQLLRDGVKCPKESEFYHPRECDALYDWECVEKTKHIQSLGTDIPLKDGECIPALPMVVAMCYWADKGLNDALKSVGGKPFDMSEYYWSVTEGGSNYAWFVGFGDGNVYNYYGKYYSGVVRPVAAFNL